MSRHNEIYKSVQVNLSWKKHKAMIEWLINKADDEETSLNSIIIRAIKKEYLKDVEKYDRGSEEGGE